MSTRSELSAEFDKLSAKLAKAETHLDEKKLWNFGDHLTAGQLKARHAFLQKQLDHDAHDAEVHGHHVSDLEKSVMAWVKGPEIHG
ncbi:3-ketoacyl-ACP reductase [Halovulum sp. GXIMD14793]